MSDEVDEGRWPRSSSTTFHRGRYKHDDDEDDDEDEYEIAAYRANDDSGDSSPFLDHPPRLPSPSTESYASGKSGDTQQSLERPPDDQREITETQHVDSVSRQALAQRLARIARQLATTTDDEFPIDELVLTEQVNQLEMTLLGIPSPNAFQDGKPPEAHPLAVNLATVLPDGARQLATTRSPPTQEAVNETATQLSQDLETLHNNLRARHEEATHIQALLLSRLELAAQRILFLQDQAAEFENLLRDSDDESSHLRVLLKALEIQVPKHPDEDLRRCLARVREEFWAVRKRREARRQNLMAHTGG